MVNGGTVNYAANNLNQYNSVGSVYYDYDLNGNTTPFDKLRAGFDGVAFYIPPGMAGATYDAENRLTNIDSTTGTGHHEYGYTYDKVGNRLILMPPSGSSADPISFWPDSSGRACLFFLLAIGRFYGDILAISAIGIV